MAPGVSFNVPYKNHFRVTTLPDSSMLRDVFGRIEELLTEYASKPSEAATDSAGQGTAAAGSASNNVLEARSRFK